MVTFDASRVLDLMMRLNPWWQTGHVPAEFHRPMKRDAFHRVLKSFPLERAILVLGPRRVGKTTVMYQVIEHLLNEKVPPKTILYLSLDHPVLKSVSLGGLLDLYRNNVLLHQDSGYVFLDEIHYAQEWDLWLKSFIDRKLHFKIVASGSASAAIEKKGRESGVGRWTELKMPPLPFREFATLKGIEVARSDTLRFLEKRKPFRFSGDDLKEFRSILSKDRVGVASLANALEIPFQEYLLKGGIPEVTFLDSTLELQRLLREDVAEKVLYRDMAVLYGVRNLLVLEQLFLHIAYNTAQLLSTDSLSKQLGISRAAVYNYIGYLEKAFLITTARNYARSPASILRSRMKAYVTDIGVRNAVALKGNEILSQPAELGLIVETLAFNSLANYANSQGGRCYYWREAEGVEVDVVVDIGGHLLPVETKYKRGITSRDTRSLEKFMERFGVDCGVMLTKTFEELDKPKILSVPTWLFLYAL